jgi:hypothetical protein
VEGHQGTKLGAPMAVVKNEMGSTISHENSQYLLEHWRRSQGKWHKENHAREASEDGKKTGWE